MRPLSRRSLLAAAASASVVAGCVPAARTPDQAAASLAEAFRVRDEAAFLDCFAPTTRAEQCARRLWQNWITLDAACEAAPSAGLTVAWRIPGEPSACQERVTVVVEHGRIVDVTGSPAPAWLTDVVTLRRTTGAAVLCARALPDAEASAWLTAAGEASRAVGAAGLGIAAKEWGQVLVVVLTASPDAFASASGLDPDAAAATQAVTVMASSASPARIVVNGAAARALDAAGLRVALVHEGVHVATRSAISAAPLWLVEGVAESVASADDPATRRRNAALAREASGIRALPTRAELNGPQAPTAYALAALAVDACSARWGRAAVMSWLADWTAPGRPDEAEMTDAFLAARRP